MKISICHKIKTIAVALLPLLAVNAAAAEYDVAAYVWPAYQPEPRWAELGIFGDGKGEWQNLYESVKRNSYRAREFLAQRWLVRDSA